MRFQGPRPTCSVARLSLAVCRYDRSALTYLGREYKNTTLHYTCASGTPPASPLLVSLVLSAVYHFAIIYAQHGSTSAYLYFYNMSFCWQSHGEAAAVVLGLSTNDRVIPAATPTRTYIASFPWATRTSNAFE